MFKKIAWKNDFSRSYGPKWRQKLPCSESKNLLTKSEPLLTTPPQNNRVTKENFQWKGRANLNFRCRILLLGDVQKNCWFVIICNFVVDFVVFNMILSDKIQAIYLTKLTPFTDCPIQKRIYLSSKNNARITLRWSSNTPSSWENRNSSQRSWSTRTLWKVWFCV